VVGRFIPFARRIIGGGLVSSEFTEVALRSGIFSVA
jgi:hypothetical protein